MAFDINRFGSNSSNIKSIMGGVNDYRYYNKDGNTLTTPGYFPDNLGLEVGDRIRVVPQTKTNADEIYVVSSVTNGVVTVTQIDTDGAVDSVNGKTGAVVLDASDVHALPDSTVIPAAIQYETMPTADESNVGKIVEFVGATDATYTNGYFYKCVSDGQQPATYSWTQVSVQPAPSGLPDQTGQSGKFLTTDGTDASWATVNALTNNTTTPASDQNLSVGANAITGNTKCTLVGVGASKTAQFASGGTAVGCEAIVGSSSVALGQQTESTGNGTVAIGSYAKCSGATAILINASSSTITNSEANTFKVANGNGTYTIMDANGNLPADRLASISGLADGNYRLRLTMASGVPTLTWVAE